MARIRKGDTVVVISGRDKGKVGKVLQVSPNDHGVIIQGSARAGKIRVASVAVRDAKSGKLGTIRLGRSSITGKDVLEPYPKKGGKNLASVRAAVRDVIGGER